MRTINTRIGPISQILNLGYGHCARCLTTWQFVEGRSIPYLDNSGTRFFACCVKCWADTTEDERVQYYVQESNRLRRLWGGYSTPELIEAAVRSESRAELAGGTSAGTQTSSERA